MTLEELNDLLENGDEFNPIRRDMLLRIYTKAEELIRAGWTRGTYARTAEGVAIEYGSKDAAYFCSMGAILRATWELTQPATSPSPAEFSLYVPLVETIRSTHNDNNRYVDLGVASWNDTCTYETVCAAFAAAKKSLTIDVEKSNLPPQ